MDEAVKNEVRNSLRPLSGRAKKTRASLWADELGCSIDTIYRYSRNGVSGRKRRSDRDVRRSAVSGEAKKAMYSMSVRWGFSAREVIGWALAEGIIEEPVHESTYNAWRRADGIPARALTKPGKIPGAIARNRLKKQPHRSFEAERSNQIHQIDLTELKSYFVQEGENVIGFEVDLGPNRPTNGYPRLQLTTIIDDHSRCLYAEVGRTKDTDAWMDFCISAWTKRDDGLYGVPSILYGDREGAAIGTRFKAFAADMGVEYIPHRPGNSAAKGKVESGAIKYLKNRLSRLLVVYYDQGRPVSIEEVNERLSAIVYEKNGREHSVTGEEPLSRFQRGLKNVRLLPEREKLLIYYYTSHTRRVLSDLTVRLDGVQYQLPRREPFLSLAGGRIDIRSSTHPARSQHLICVVDGDCHIIDAVQAAPDVAENIRSLPKSRAEQHIEAAYETDLSGLDPARIYDRTPKPNTTSIPLPESVQEQEPEITKIEAKARLLREGRADLIGSVDGVFDGREKIPESEYHALAAG